MFSQAGIQARKAIILSVRNAKLIFGLSLQSEAVLVANKNIWKTRFPRISAVVHNATTFTSMSWNQNNCKI